MLTPKHMGGSPQKKMRLLSSYLLWLGPETAFYMPMKANKSYLLNQNLYRYVIVMDVSNISLLDQRKPFRTNQFLTLYSKDDLFCTETGGRKIHLALTLIHCD